MSRPLTFSHLSPETFETAQKGAGRKGPRYREAISCLPCRNRKVRCSRELPCRQCRDRSHECSYTKAPGKKSVPPRSRPDGAAFSLPTPPSSCPGVLTPTTRYFQPGWAAPAGAANSRQKSNASSSPKQGRFAGQEYLEKGPDQLRYPSPPEAEATLSVSSETPFVGSNFGSRILGPTHWMAPCKDMLVVKAMLDGSDGFVTNRKAFTELMDMARSANKLPLPLTHRPSGLDATHLRHLLQGASDRRETRQWVQSYLTGWGRIYQIVDAATLSADMDNLYNTATMDDTHRKPGGTASLLRVLLVVSVAMQRSEKHRLQGRHLGKCVEDFLYATAGSREPCMSLVQALLLLLVLKIIEASDTDSISSSMGVQGLTSQVVLSIGLHRDPSLFPGESIYQKEVRKRLWACYLRLSLEFSVRTGTPFPVHLEDTDCPLPAPTRISRLDILPPSPSSRCDADPEAEEADAIFGLAAAKLARVVVPMQRALCSSVPKASQCELSVKETAATFDSYIAEIPPSLKIDCVAKTLTDAILVLQRSILSINMHSISLMVALRSVLRESPDPSQKARMMEVWDHAVSILDVFQNLLQLGEHRGPGTADAAAADMAHQLLWPDAVRAALYACVLVGRMCRLDSGHRALWPGAAPRNTIATVCQSLLATPLAFMCRFWQRRFHLGPVATKVSLLLAVALTVTSTLEDASGADADAAREWTPDSKQRFMLMGVTVVDEWVAGMKAAFEARGREDRATAAAAAAGSFLLGDGKAGPPPSHNDILSANTSSTIGATPYGELPTHASVSPFSPSLGADSGFGDFDLNCYGIFGQGFEFDSVEWFMMQAMGQHGHGDPLSPATQSSGRE